MTNVWAMTVPLPGEYPIILAELGVHVQAKFAPVTFEVRRILVVFPEHVWVDKGLFDRLGFGLTVSTKSVTGPGQALAVGVI